MDPRRARPQPLTTAFVAAVFASGCYTTSNTVTVTPLDTKYPVSASGQYVTPSGDIVEEKGYNVVEAFEFTKKIEAPRHEEAETELMLEPELNRLMQQHQGDAITQLNIAATRYDPGSHGSAAGWKIIGWTFGITGGTFLLLGATADDDTSGPIMTVGGVFAGLGALGFVLSGTTNDPATWELKVSGQVVKQGGGAAPGGGRFDPLLLRKRHERED